MPIHPCRVPAASLEDRSPAYGPVPDMGRSDIQRGVTLSPQLPQSTLWCRGTILVADSVSQEARGSRTVRLPNGLSRHSVCRRSTTGCPGCRPGATRSAGSPDGRTGPTALVTIAEGADRPTLRTPGLARGPCSAGTKEAPMNKILSLVALATVLAVGVLRLGGDGRHAGGREKQAHFTRAFGGLPLCLVSRSRRRSRSPERTPSTTTTTARWSVRSSTSSSTGRGATTRPARRWTTGHPAHHRQLRHPDIDRGRRAPTRHRRRKGDRPP